MTQKYPKKPSKINMVFADERQATLYINHYLTSNQKREALRELGHLGFILLDHYLF